MNAGALGVLLYTVVIVVLTNASARGVRSFVSGQGSYLWFTVGGTFIALFFRTLWYGPSPAINGIIIAGFIEARPHSLFISDPRSLPHPSNNRGPIAITHLTAFALVGRRFRRNDRLWVAALPGRWMRLWSVASEIRFK